MKKKVVLKTLRNLPEFNECEAMKIIAYSFALAFGIEGALKGEMESVGMPILRAGASRHP